MGKKENAKGNKTMSMNDAGNLTGRLGIYEESATLPDGLQIGDVKKVGTRVFQLARAGAVALAAGKLTVNPAIVTNHVNMVLASAAVIGDRTLTITLGATAVTANQYKDGYVVCRSLGQAYKIKSHPAADASADVIVTLYDKVEAAISTSIEIDLQLNPLNGTLISVVDQADTPTGWPLIAVTATYYYWSQIKGPVAALMDENVTAGAAVTIGTSVAGAVEAQDAAGEPVVGHMLQAGVDTKYNMVAACIEEM